jgi:hypothetical protein
LLSERFDHYIQEMALAWGNVGSDLKDIWVCVIIR